MPRSEGIQAINYEKGMSYDEAIEKRASFEKTSDEGYKKALASIRGDEPTDDVGIIRLWQSLLIKNGRNLDAQLDAFTSEVIRCGDSWRDSKSKVKNLLELLIESHTAVRAFEEEVEDYILYNTTHTTLRDEMTTPPTLILTDINGTFSRAYDLCIQKLNAIHNDRRTVTNILLSVVAVILAILSLVVAVHNPFTPPSAKVPEASER